MNGAGTLCTTSAPIIGARSRWVHAASCEKLGKMVGAAGIEPTTPSMSKAWEWAIIGRNPPFFSSAPPTCTKTMSDDTPPCPGYTRPEQDEIARLVGEVIERAQRAGVHSPAGITDMLLRELRKIGAKLVLRKEGEK